MDIVSMCMLGMLYLIVGSTTWVVVNVFLTNNPDAGLAPDRYGLIVLVWPAVWIAVMVLFLAATLLKIFDMNP